MSIRTMLFFAAALGVVSLPLVAQKYQIRTGSEAVLQQVDGVYYPSLETANRMDRARAILVREALKKGLCLEVDIDVLETGPVYFDPAGGVVGASSPKGDCKDITEKPQIGGSDPGNIDWGPDGPPLNGESVVAHCKENGRELLCEILARTPCDPTQEIRGCTPLDPRLIYVLDEPYGVQTEGCDDPTKADNNCPYWARPLRGDIDPTREHHEIKVACRQFPELCEVDLEFLGRRPSVAEPPSEQSKLDDEIGCRKCREMCQNIYAHNNEECLEAPLAECAAMETQEEQDACATKAYQHCASQSRPRYDSCMNNSCANCP